VVSKFGVGSRLVLVCGMILFGSSVVGSAVMAQSGNAGETPFIGFRPFGSGQAVPAGTSGTASGAVNTQSQSTTRPSLTPEQPASAYPYPASGSPNYGAVSNSRTGTAERTSLGGRLPSTTTPTGSLNNAFNSTLGQTAGGSQAGASQANVSQAGVSQTGVAGVDPALWQRYQQELQQQQAQQQYQQYQQWLAQQQQYQLQRQTSSVGFRSQQASAGGQANPANDRVAQPTLATRPNADSTSSARTTTAKMNQPVVQQVSSTTTSNRENSVAHADWSSWVTAKSPSTTGNASTTNSTSVAKQAASVANSVAKPQCCCVPQNCCVPRNCCAPTTPAPTTPAPVFRPQTVTPLARPVANQVPSLGLPNLALPNLAANQVPTLGPSANSTFGGFLGQAGANYQVQPLGTNQFQAGLGVPQFRSTGALGTGLGIGSGGGLGSWFSNGLFGTGAYTPLLPLVNAQGARLGQGIIGQPTAYLDGQPLRNLLRYLSP